VIRSWDFCKWRVEQGRNHVFKVGEVQCLGVGYCTEQNTDGIPSFVHCRLLRNGSHTLPQKSWGGPSNFFGGEAVRTPLTPQWLRPNWSGDTGHAHSRRHWYVHPPPRLSVSSRNGDVHSGELLQPEHECRDPWH